MLEPFQIHLCQKKLTEILKQNTQHIILNDCEGFPQGLSKQIQWPTSTSSTTMKSTETFSCSKRRISLLSKKKSKLCESAKFPTFPFQLHLRESLCILTQYAVKWHSADLPIVQLYENSVMGVTSENLKNTKSIKYFLC